MWLMATALGFTGDELVAKAAEAAPFRDKAALVEMAPAIPEKMYRDAASGKVQTNLKQVEGHKARIAYAVGVVNAPIGKFYAAINDEEGKVANSKLTYAEILRGEKCGVDRDVFMFLPVSLITDRYWVLHLRQNEPMMAGSGGKVRQTYWTSKDVSVPEGSKAKTYLDAGMPIAFAKGGWLLIELDATHTLVEYWTWTDPGGYVPAGLASSFASGSIKDTYTNMTALANKGPACSVR